MFNIKKILNKINIKNDNLFFAVINVIIAVIITIVIIFAPLFLLYLSFVGMLYLGLKFELIIIVLLILLILRMTPIIVMSSFFGIFYLLNYNIYLSILCSFPILIILLYQFKLGYDDFINTQIKNKINKKD